MLLIFDEDEAALGVTIDRATLVTFFDRGVSAYLMMLIALFLHLLSTHQMFE